MRLEWFQCFCVVFSTYLILYFNLKDLTHVVVLSGVAFVTGFFYLLNFNGTGALKYLIGHTILVTVGLMIGLSLGAITAFRYGSMGLARVSNVVGFIKRLVF